MSAFKSGLDAKTIREGYERLGGNPFGIKPDAPLKPVWICDAHNCTRSHDPNTQETRGTCSGYCSCY